MPRLLMTPELPPQPDEAERFWLWVFDEPAGLEWVIANRQMAFGSAKRRALEIRPGDRAVIYVTAGGLRGSGRSESLHA